MANPQRTCLGCGKVRPQAELIRLAKGPDGKVMLDVFRRAGGRGGYLCGVACLDGASKKKAWGRAFRSRVDVESEVLRRELALLGGASPPKRSLTPGTVRP